LIKNQSQFYRVKDEFLVGNLKNVVAEIKFFDTHQSNYISAKDKKLEEFLNEIDNEPKNHVLKAKALVSIAKNACLFNLKQKRNSE